MLPAVQRRRLRRGAGAAFVLQGVSAVVANMGRVNDG